MLKAIEIGIVLQEPLVNQLLNERRAKPFHVHGIPACKIFDASLCLSQAQGIVAAQVHANPRQVAVALRAGGGFFKDGLRSIPLFFYDGYDLRDNLTGLLQYDVIATRMSFRAISSKLWRVARLTVVPASNTG